MEERQLGQPKSDLERAAQHFGVPEGEVTLEMLKHVEGIPRGSGLERSEIEDVAMDIRDVALGAAMGEGAIPLYGRELRKEPCACCLIDPEGPNEPANRMCTTKSAIGTMKDSEEREWCSVINIVPDGRCGRARKIREVAKECKERHPKDTAKFFECFAPSFAKITK